MVNLERAFGWKSLLRPTGVADQLKVSSGVLLVWQGRGAGDVDLGFLPDQTTGPEFLHGSS